MSAVDSQICSRCNSTGHRAAQCPKMPFYKTCEYCKVVGHGVKACPVLQRKALEKVSKQKEAEKKAANDACSESGTSTTASSERAWWQKRAAKKGKSRTAWSEWHPEHWVLSEDEEREARKLEKKLREIAALEQLVEQGKHLDSLQLQKVDRRSEIESHEVLRKVRLGYQRIALPAAS
ncbi:clpC [Symbiodinium necroappetens]|uniref:ClpC protein n=1 Tax=Symbiodinium necroappetens TaxID=1628268 RepID=A0A812X199_9DINO|nr:clpC [Symbiodinium necroappetens]